MPRITKSHIDALAAFRTEIDQILDSCASDLDSSGNEAAVKAVNLILRSFFSPSGLPVAEERDNAVKASAGSTRFSTDKLDAIFDKLIQHGILKELSDHQFVISDSTLAATIFNRLDLELQILREAKSRFGRYYENYLDNGALMKEVEYSSVSPFIEALDLSPEQIAFARKSRNELRKKTRRRFVVLSSVLTVIVSLLLIVVYLQIEKNRETEALYTEIAAKKDSLEMFNLDLRMAIDSLNSQQVLLDMTIEQLSAKRNELEVANARLIAQADSITALLRVNENLLDSTVYQNALLTQQRNEIEKQKAQLEVLNNELELRNKKLSDVNSTLARLQAIAVTRNVANEAVKLDANNSEFKAALALEAYNFNKGVEGGNVFYPGIYSALYYGARDLHGPETFNTGYDNASDIIRHLVSSPTSGLTFGVGAGGTLGCAAPLDWDNNTGLSGLDPLGRKEHVPVYSARVQEDKLLLTTYDGSVIALSASCPVDQLWRVDLGKPTPARFALLIGENRLALTGSTTVRIMDLNNRAIIRTDTIADGTQPITIESADRAEGSNIIVLGMSNGKVAVYNTISGDYEFLQVLNKPVTAISYFVLTSGNEELAYLATGYADGSFHIWLVRNPSALEAKAAYLEMPTRGFRIIKSASTHSARISDIVLSPLQKYLAVASYDGTVSIWNTEAVLRQNNPVYLPIIIDDHSSWVTGVAFSPNDKMIVTAEPKGKVKKFHLDPEYYAREICRHKPSRIPDEEWRRYFGQDTMVRQQGCDNEN